MAGHLSLAVSGRCHLRRASNAVPAVVADARRTYQELGVCCGADRCQKRSDPDDHEPAGQELHSRSRERLLGIGQVPAIGACGNAHQHSAGKRDQYPAGGDARTPRTAVWSRAATKLCNIAVGSRFPWEFPAGARTSPAAPSLPLLQQKNQMPRNPECGRGSRAHW